MGLLNLLKSKKTNQEEEQKYIKDLTNPDVLKKLVGFLSADKCQNLYALDSHPSKKQLRASMLSTIRKSTAQDKNSFLNTVQSYADYLKSPLFKNDTERASLLQQHLKDTKKLANSHVMDPKKDGAMMVAAENALTAQAIQMALTLKDKILPKDAYDRLNGLRTAQNLAFVLVLDAMDHMPTEKRIQMNMILRQKGKQAQVKPIQNAGESR
jgi:hypothetical protein